MKHLMNRELIKRNVFQNYAEVANDTPVPPMNRFFAKDIPQRAFDPDKAKFHLNKAGALSGPLQITTSPAATGSVEMGLVLQASARSRSA